jgi:hypothetical protein
MEFASICHRLIILGLARGSFWLARWRALALLCRWEAL